KEQATVEATVVRLSRQDPAVAKRSSTVITPNGPWTQTLYLSPGQRAFRVDLRVRNKLHRAPLPPALAWKIVEHAAAGVATAKATGKSDLADLPDPMFAPLRFA